MKTRILAGFIVVITLFTACKKQELRLITKEEKRLEGTWNIDETRTQVTDSMGVVISDSIEFNTGTVEFRIAEDDAEVPFNLVLFNNITGSNALVGYFQGYNAGFSTTTGGWAVYWDADPDSKRILFWGITSGGSYHKTVNLELDGNKKQTLSYVQSFFNNPNERTFYTFKLSKQ